MNEVTNTPPLLVQFADKDNCYLPLPSSSLLILKRAYTVSGKMAHLRKLNLKTLPEIPTRSSIELSEMRDESKLEPDEAI